MTQVSEAPPVARKALMMPHEAAERLIPKFKKMARQLRPNNPLLRQDLVQEMCLACLSISVPMTLTSFCAHALRRALNMLEKEAQVEGIERAYKVMRRPKIVRGSQVARND